MRGIDLLVYVIQKAKSACVCLRSSFIYSNLSGVLGTEVKKPEVIKDVLTQLSFEICQESVFVNKLPGLGPHGT